MHIHLNSGNDIETPAQMVETSFFRWRGSLVVRLLNVASLKKKKEKHTSKRGRNVHNWENVCRCLNFSCFSLADCCTPYMFIQYKVNLILREID